MKSRYLEYLPAIHQQDPHRPEDPFLGRFLLPFEEVLTGFGELLSTVDRYFAPDFTDPEFLSWLATWVALVLDEEWDEAKRRRLIGEAVELYRWRGTVRGLKRYLEIYTGLVPDIRECRWPGGMQIGVASRIGGLEPPHTSLSTYRVKEHRQSFPAPDYYVVHTVEYIVYTLHYVVEILDDEDRHPVLYRADRVERFDSGVHVDDQGNEQPYVDIWYSLQEGEPIVPVHHEPARLALQFLPDGYYRADGVESVDVGVAVDDQGQEHPYVDIWLSAPDDGPPTREHHEPAILTQQPLRLCYRAALVKRVRVDVENESVEIERFPAADHPSQVDTWQPATIARRDGLEDNLYVLETEAGTQVEYRGDTVLIDEQERPYCFIVDVQVPVADLEKVRLDKVRAIVDLEKPAHTMYYLKLTPEVSEYVLQPMQIEVRSTIEVDTTLG